MTNNHPTNEHLESIKLAAELLDGDTWHTEGNSVYGSAYDAGDSVCYDLITSCESVNGESPTADFIALADPSTVLALIAEVQECRQALSGLPADAIKGGWTWAKFRAYADELKAELTKIKKDELQPLPITISFDDSRETPALRDVAAERQRQITDEGWAPDHDDEHVNGQLAAAAACYALFANTQFVTTPAPWPWSLNWWKQSGQRRDLVKAGALILAEIERIDRQEQAINE